MKKWEDILTKFGNPIARLEKYLLRENLITADQNAELRENAKNSVRESLKAANALPKPEIDVMFTDVYENMPQHIIDQKEELRAHLRKYPDQYNLKNFHNGENWIK
jgi:2-oxoisovalerate dehydrogenase E1 component alpha subunit